MAQKNSLHSSGTLKKLVDAGKKTTRVLGSVERYYLSLPADRSRATDVIHPSEMIKPDWCHRAQYYLLKGEDPAPRHVSLDLALVFEEGHRIHARWQDWFAGMGTLYGLWACKDCRHTFWATSPTVPCGSCSSSKGFVYREVPVQSQAHMISGHADGWLKGLGNDLLLEIKSVGEGTARWEDPAGWIESGNDFKKYWATLTSPFYGHLMQAQVYMKLLELMFPGETTPQEAVFIYESKVDQKRKELVVSKSDFGVTELFDTALSIVEAVKNDTPPACNVNNGTMCKKCEVYSDN
jgi:hypothetical protein